jgi:hypothetical protein
MSIFRKENGSLVKKAGAAFADLTLNADSTNAVSNKAVTAAITQLNNDLTELSEKVGAGMKCALIGNGIAKANVPLTVDISSLNLTSTEDYFIIINGLVSGGNYAQNMGYILTKTATEFTIKGQGSEGIYIGYQVITLK